MRLQCTLSRVVVKSWINVLLVKALMIVVIKLPSPQGVAEFISALFLNMTNFAWLEELDWRISETYVSTISTDTCPGMKEGSRNIVTTLARNTKNECLGKDCPSQ